MPQGVHALEVWLHSIGHSIKLADATGSHNTASFLILRLLIGQGCQLLHFLQCPDALEHVSVKGKSTTTTIYCNYNKIKINYGNRTRLLL